MQYRPQAKCQYSARAERVGERALTGKRQAKHVRLGDGALRRLASGRDNEVADAASFDLGGAFDERQRFRRQLRL